MAKNIKTKKSVDKLTAFTVSDAIELIKSKKGAGVSKSTFIKVDIRVKSDIIRTQGTLEMLQAVLTLIEQRGGAAASTVETEIENNPDWGM